MAKAKAKQGTGRGAKSTAKSAGKSSRKASATTQRPAKTNRPAAKTKGLAAKTKGRGKAKSGPKRSTGAKKSPPTQSAARGVANRRPAGGRRPSKKSRPPRAGSVGSGKGTIGKSGEGLDGGVARYEAGDPGAVGTRPASTRRPEPRKARAQLPGEKAIADTDQTVPLRPERPAPGEREPIPPVALDQRRQIVGTDDPGDADDASDFEDMDDEVADAP